VLISNDLHIDQPPIAKTVNVAPDRVSERRRATQLARHYRDVERLTIADIAQRLGRTQATVKAYLHDPTGEKARAVKRRYQGVCQRCGAPTQARNGKHDAYTFCKACHPGAIARKWTRDQIREAMRAWQQRYGTPPTSYDWSRTHATRLVAHPRHPAGTRRVAAAARRRMAAVEHRHDAYGSWAAARADPFPDA